MRDFSERYLSLLKGQFSGINLTRILDENDFFEKQILDSVNPLEKSKIFAQEILKTNIIVDIGFGGGFPLLPLAKKFPNVKCIGIETRNKKATAVQEIAKILNLDNVKTIHNRLENIEFDIPCVITFKAVGKIQDFLPLLNISSKGVLVVFYKGPSVDEDELKEFNKKLNIKWSIVEDVEIQIPGTIQRRLISFSKNSVPRGTSKDLVKLSNIL